MSAHKIRYDEQFIDPRNKMSASDAFSFGEQHYIPVSSPARELQENLETRIANSVSIGKQSFEDTLSSGKKVAIIFAFSSILWAGIVLAGIAIY